MEMTQHFSTGALLMARLIKSLLLAGVASLACLTVTVGAQESSKRLILTDGSYQIVTKWEIKGDRVRYYSTERDDWEELPNSLVDWPATEKYNQEMANRGAAPKQQIRDRTSDDQAGKAEEAAEAESPLVAPGLRLPDGGGVFLLDTFQNQPQLVEVAQNGGELNPHTGRNILRAVINPLSAKQTIELEGEHAKVQSHVMQPAIYVNVDTGINPEFAVHPPPSGKDKQPADRYGIVRLEKKTGLRVVGNLKVAMYGKVSQKENWIKTTSTAVGDWTKVTPVEALPVGEYAVVEIMGKDQVNLYVWDFGVDPSAPANANAWTARQPDPSAQDRNQGPVLERRPK
jgi:hypothetical protein